MHLTYHAFLKEAEAEGLLRAFDAWSTNYLPSALADHLCYKCVDSAEFESIRRLFEQDSAFIYQSIIAGRRIAIIKLPHPLETKLGMIGYLELSDQKPDGSQKNGFDHIEIYPKLGSVQDLLQTLEEKGCVWKKIVRPHHTTFDTSLEAGIVRLEEEPLLQKIIREEMR